MMELASSLSLPSPVAAPHAFLFPKPEGCTVWYGVGCQIRRQAGHGAAHSLATYFEAAELIPRHAAANAHIFLKDQLPF